MERSVDEDLDRIERAVVHRGRPPAQVELARLRYAAFVDPAPRALAKRIEPAQVAASCTRHDVEVLLVRKRASQANARMSGSASGGDRLAYERFAYERRPV